MNILKRFDYCMDVDDYVCNVCASEHPEWEESIKSQIAKEDPVDWQGWTEGLSPDYWIWLRSEELWKKHHVRCLRFAYDDITLSFCKHHLHELSKVLD